MRAAASRTFCTAGTSSPIRMAMMAITTSSSIRVKPRRDLSEAMGYLTKKETNKERRSADEAASGPHNRLTLPLPIPASQAQIEQENACHFVRSRLMQDATRPYLAARQCAILKAE